MTVFVGIEEGRRCLGPSNPNLNDNAQRTSRLLRSPDRVETVLSLMRRTRKGVSRSVRIVHCHATVQPCHDLNDLECAGSTITEPRCTSVPEILARTVDVPPDCHAAEQTSTAASTLPLYLQPDPLYLISLAERNPPDRIPRSRVRYH